MATATTSRFVQVLLRSQLLSGARREELLRLQTRFTDSRELALELVSRGWLTSFQVGQLAKGKGNDLVVGPYVLLDRLGEGGMGHVYKARHKGLDRIVALKVIRKECLTNPKTARRFLREIRATSALCHPNIVRAFDADQAGELHYIAMEYIDGIDLGRLVEEIGPLPVALACDLVRQAALGLEHAHAQGMIHRDIKPANLLVSGLPLAASHGRKPANGSLKILDMGLARFTDPAAECSLLDLTQQGIVMGTPEYMAPEQALDSHECDIRADLYSLGCTFYYLLAGRVPFPDGNLTEKLMHHQHSTPDPVSQVRRTMLMARAPQAPPAEDEFDLPETVEEVVRYLMAKKREDRFQSPAELVVVLREIQKHLYGEPAPIEPPAPAEDIGVKPEPAPIVQVNVPSLHWTVPHGWLIVLISALATAILGLLSAVALFAQH